MSNIFIQRLKLSVTTQCNLRCRYCFVKKRDGVMSFFTARNSINLLLSFPQKDNRSLCVYGGEPLLYPRLDRQIVRYAYLQSKRLHRRLAIAYCTNGILLNKSILNFFHRYGVFLNISLFARHRIHDRNRPNALGKGTFEQVIKNISFAKRILPEQLLSIGLCVSPDTAKDLEEDVMCVTEKLDIRYFSLEIIRRSVFLWTDDSVAQFRYSFKNVLNKLIKGIEESDFFFIDSLSRELIVKHSSLLGNISEKLSLCPRRFCFEVYPDGEIAFSAFLHNKAGRRKYLLGNVNCFEKSRIAHCDFLSDSAACRDCIQTYFISADALPHEVLLNKYYHGLLIQAAALLRRRAQEETIFRRYIQKAYDRVY